MISTLRGRVDQKGDVAREGILKGETFSRSICSFAVFQKYRETTKLTGGWVDAIAPLYHPDADRSEFLVLAPVLDGSHGHFRHIMRVQVCAHSYITWDRKVQA